LNNKIKLEQKKNKQVILNIFPKAVSKLKGKLRGKNENDIHKETSFAFHQGGSGSSSGHLYPGWLRPSGYHSSPDTHPTDGSPSNSRPTNCHPTDSSPAYCSANGCA
jgi:hypothetical protein